jgi:hypothetical protein
MGLKKKLPLRLKDKKQFDDLVKPALQQKNDGTIVAVKDIKMGNMVIPSGAQVSMEDKPLVSQMYQAPASAGSVSPSKTNASNAQGALMNVFPNDLHFAFTAKAVKKPFFRKLANDNYEHPDNLWSKGCWIIQGVNVLVGGAVCWDKHIVLRHLGSGRYLSVDVVSG